jgi:hypothetical protein
MGGTEIELQGAWQSWRDVARMFENDSADVPMLSESGVQIVGDFLRDQGCVMVAGYLPAERLPIGQVVSLRSRNAFDPAGETFRGPHLSESGYYPNGVGIWTASPER